MRKIRTANNNAPKPQVFNVERLRGKAFQLSRLQAFIDGHDDIFDVLADTHQEKTAP